MQMDYETEYFWSKPKAASRGRFNLLLLEYGEIFYENLSVYQYPVPNNSLKFVECDALKVKGRLHVCSRSIIFEPNNIKKPLLKFPYKSITSDVEQFRLKPEELMQCSVNCSGFGTFRCSGYFEMKDNDQIGPYKHIDCSLTHNQNDSGKVLCAESRFVFALVHSDINAFFATIKRLREEMTGSARGEGLISLRKQRSPHQSSEALPFDSSQLVDFQEQLLFPEAVHAVRVGPLVLHPGGLMLTGDRLYFQPSRLNNIGDSVQHFDVSKIRRIYSRRYLLRQTGLEIFFIDGNSSSRSGKCLSSVYFVFESTEIRDFIVATIEGLPSFPRREADGIDSIETMTGKWQRKEVSNFDYLLFLNSEADRSFSDLTQYPIMPHILADYQSRKLDLTKKETFRDLSKPVGALNPQRLAFFRERFASMSSVAIEAEEGMTSFPPPFLYGTHYSTPGYVLYYLVRVAPEHMLCLQNGKFDAADRMFYSVEGMFSSCLSNPADLKELIPEFFQGDGEFLSNTECLNLGRRHNGERVDDVDLPPWARSPKDFIKKSRQALESDYVSSNLHHWIDLIFGYKQRGEAALSADNLFYHLTYEGSLDLDSEFSPPPSSSIRGEGQSRSSMEREAIDVQIQEFGQTPKQLFARPHPQRGGPVTPATLGSLPPLGSPTPHAPHDNDSPKKSIAAYNRLVRPQSSGSVPGGEGTVFDGHRQREAPPTAGRGAEGQISVDMTRMERKHMQPVAPSSSSSSSSSNSSSSSSSGSGSGSGSSSGSGSGSSAYESSSIPVRDNSRLPVTANTDSDKSSQGGLILLGDDFRAEVTRELLAQQDILNSEPSSPSSRMPLGALVVKVNGTHSKGVKSDQEILMERADRSDLKVEDPRDGDAAEGSVHHAISPAAHPAAHMKARMQTLWGTLSEKATAIIRPDKRPLGGDPTPMTPSATPSSSTPLKQAPPPLSTGHPPSPSSESCNNTPGPPALEMTEPVLPISVMVQLCKMHQLPRKQSITGISALQLPSDRMSRMVICASTTEAQVNIFHSETFWLQPEAEVEDKNVGIRQGGGKNDAASGARSAIEDLNLNRDCGDAQTGRTILALTSSFLAGTMGSAGPPPPPSVFSPLALIPSMLSTTFAAQPLSECFLSSCRFSSDASRVLVAAQHRQYCSLYSYTVPDGRIAEQNSILIGSAPSPATGHTGTCVAVGRGSHFIVSGARDGSVRLWSLSLSAPMPPTGLSKYSINSLRGGTAVKEEKRQVPIADLSDMQSPVVCVALTVAHPDTVLSNGNRGSSSATRLVAAAGAKDGTVAVWDAYLTEKAAETEFVSKRLLFCHQLRPSERSVVCIEWLPMAATQDQPQRDPRGEGESKDQLLLLTGAIDGCLHCVDCSGRVLAICEVLSGEVKQSAPSLTRSPHLRAMTATKSAEVQSSSSSSSLIFCGFSDGSVKVISLMRTSVQISSSPASNSHRQSGPIVTSVQGQRVMREVIQMRVVMGVPGMCSQPPCSAIASIFWLGPDSACPQVGRDKESHDTSTLITGDEEGCLRLFKLTVIRPVSPVRPVSSVQLAVIR